MTNNYIHKALYANVDGARTNYHRINAHGTYFGSIVPYCFVVSGGGGVFNHSNIEAVLIKRHPGDSRRNTSKQGIKQIFLDLKAPT